MCGTNLLAIDAHEESEHRGKSFWGWTIYQENSDDYVYVCKNCQSKSKLILFCEDHDTVYCDCEKMRTLYALMGGEELEEQLESITPFHYRNYRWQEPKEKVKVVCNECKIRLVEIADEYFYKRKMAALKGWETRRRNQARRENEKTKTSNVRGSKNGQRRSTKIKP